MTKQYIHNKLKSHQFVVLFSNSVSNLIIKDQ